MRALVLLLATSIAAPAAADGLYFTESFGASDIDGELEQHFHGPFRVRAGLGMRRGAWAFELFAGAMMPATTPPRPQGSALEPEPADALVSYGLDVKYLQPVTRYFELYLRGRVAGAHMQGELEGYLGRGLGGGAGAQLRGRRRTRWGWHIGGGGFVDLGYERYRLYGDGAPALDAKITSITFGFAVGSDF
jgi:hypothetical protein